MKTTLKGLPQPSRATLPLLLLAVLLAGCAPRPILPTPAVPALLKEWLPALQERSQYWQRYQAKIRLKAQAGDKKYSFDAVILANLPDQLRLEAFRFGQTAGVLIVNRGRTTLFVPSEKAVLIAGRSEELTSYLLGIALPMDAFGYSLSASLSPAWLEGFEMAPWRQEVLGSSKPSPDQWSSVWHFTADPQTVASVNVRQGRQEFLIRYEPPVGLDVEQIPQKILLTSPEWQIEASLLELKPLSNVPEAAFTSDFGEEVKRIRVSY